MCDYNMTMKFLPEFHNHTVLDGLVSSFSQFTIALPNKLTLSCKPHYLEKGKKNNIMWEVVARRCSAKMFSTKFHKIHRERPMLQSYSFSRVETDFFSSVLLFRADFQLVETII